MTISVLLPVFEAEGTLSAALQSVRRQRGVDFECIVVDDGSTDGSRAIARSFARRDSRFVVVERRRSGLVPALEAGLSRCRGDLVARMDADDLMASTRLRDQAASLAANPGWAGVGARVRLFPRRSLGRGLREYERWVNGIETPADVRREAAVECPVVHPTLAIRREILERMSYRDVGWPEDYDLVLRLLAKGHELGVVPKRLLAWRHGGARLSFTDSRYRPERFAECKATYLAEGFLSGAPDYVLCGYGSTGKSLARALRRLGMRPSHVVDVHPGRMGASVDGIPVRGPDGWVDLPRSRILVSVAREEPRRAARRFLESQGLRETRDFVCVA